MSPPTMKYSPIAILATIVLLLNSSCHLINSSAIKGHAPQQQQQQQQRQEQQQQQLAIKSPIQQQQQQQQHIQSARYHGSLPAQAAPSTPILESTKKIYNDESIRRAIPPVAPQLAVQKAPADALNSSPSVVAPVIAAVPQQHQPVAAAVPAVESKPVVVSEAAAQPASSVVSSPVAKPAEPIVAAAPVDTIVAAPVVPAVVKDEAVVAAPVAAAAPKSPEVAAVPVPVVQPAEVAAPVVPVAAVPAAPAPVVVVPVAAPKVDDLPAQSERSASGESSSKKAVESVPVPQPLVAEASIVEQQVAPVVAKKEEEKEAKVLVAAAAAESPVVAQVESQLTGKKGDSASVPQQAVVQQQSSAAIEQPLVIEVPEPDPQLVLSQPIDSTTKLLIDLDEHVQKFLPVDEKQDALDKQSHGKDIAGIDYSPASPVAAAKDASGVVEGKSGVVSKSAIVGNSDVVDPAVPALIDGVAVEKAAGPASPSASSSSSSSSSSAAAAAAAAAQPPTASVAAPVGSSIPIGSASRQGGQGQHQNQQQVITQLLDQLDALQARIQDTINQLVARRRYVMSALLRPMGTYVRRVRTNLERLQTRVNQLQAAASSVGNGQNRPGGFVDAAAIETIRRRIDDISKRISDIVNRIRFSLTPTSAPLSSSNGKRR